MIGSKFLKWGIGVGVLTSLLVAGLVSVNAGLATGPKFLGNVINYSVPTNFSDYWNQVTPENGTKWGSVESNRDTMNWSSADRAYNYAKDNGMPFKFHTLVWGSQQPGWISGLSAEEQQAEVLEWFDAAAAKYGDSDMIDVVNEPLHAKPPYKDAIGGDGATGWDWVIWSFEEARKRFKGKLLINEYGIIADPPQAENYLKIIKLLQDRGLIDGIGIQCHQFNMNYVTTSTMKTVLDMLAATGLPIYVSELDINADDATQLALYKEKFPVLWEHPAVKGVTLWGYIEGQTWKADTHLITAAGAERPALVWLKEYVSGNVVTPSPTVTSSAVPSPTVTATNPPTATLVPTPTPTPTSNSGCTVSYTMYDWGGGATVSVTIKNNGSTAINNWTANWTFPGNQKISNLWCGSYTQNGAEVTVSNASYNGVIPAGGTVNFGFNISYSGTNVKPASFTLNGQACQIQ
ncbi:MAG TPA: endo-1,4-beta-xylanase [Bacillota bacterium]|nr:endo-1,4-beta-xylanase [Bacillota bacterium]